MAEPKPGTVTPRALRAWLAELKAMPKDLALLGVLSSLALVASCLPERHWDRFCAGLARAQAWRWRGDRSRAYRYVEALRPRPAGLTPAGCARAHRANVYRERLELLACYGPGARRPRVRLEGRGHLEAALRGGKGALLWVGPFAFSDLLTKVALHDGSFAVSHLSRFSHGFSGSRFGERVLNPVRTRVERRYLAERLVIGREGRGGRAPAGVAPPAGQSGGLDQRDRRRAPALSHPVSRRIRPHGWRRAEPRHPDRRAAPSGVHRTRPGPRLAPVIEPPLVRHEHWEREEAVKRLLLQYAALLEYYATRWPDQFRPGALLFEPG